jgi:hypothetical protein
VTQKKAANLNKRQIGKIRAHPVSLILGRTRVNSKLLKNFLFESTNPAVLDEVIEHILSKALKKDETAKRLLRRLAYEKCNNKTVLRGRVLAGFYRLSARGDSFGLRELTIGTKDSAHQNRFWAILGLYHLASKGNTRTLPGLLVGAKDLEKQNREWAIKGLTKLAEKGDARTVNGLIIALKDKKTSNPGVALDGLTALAKLGNKDAQKLLTEMNWSWN